MVVRPEIVKVVSNRFRIYRIFAQVASCRSSGGPMLERQFEQGRLKCLLAVVFAEGSLGRLATWTSKRMSLSTSS